MYQDGNDFAGKPHPAFIKDAHTCTHQKQLICQQLMDTVSCPEYHPPGRHLITKFLDYLP